MEINIAYACNDNYILPLCCSIVSMLENADKTNSYIIHIVHDTNSLSSKNITFIKKIFKNFPCEFEFVKINKEVFATCPLCENCNYITVETYYRYIFASLFKYMDKLLYLDCDTVIHEDISKLYSINIEDYYIAGVSDCNAAEFSERLNIEKYVNAGVLLFNLEKLRKENMEQKLFDYTRNNLSNILMQDQDVINYVFQDAIMLLDEYWNTQVGIVDNGDLCISNPIKSSKILHYICRTKPWLYEYYYIPAKKIFLHYMKKLPFSFYISKYYMKNLKRLIKNTRIKIIRYSKTKKMLVVFDKFCISLRNRS